MRRQAHLSMISPIKSSAKKEVMNFSEHSSKEDSDTHVVLVSSYYQTEQQKPFESKIPQIKQLSYGSKIITTPIQTKKPIEKDTPVIDPRQFYQSMLETSITSITATGRRTR